MNKVAMTLVTGFNLGVFVRSLLAKKIAESDTKNKIISNKNHRAMTVNFPLLISCYGRFSEKNINRFLEIIERIHKLPLSDNFIESALHKMLFKKEKYKFTKKDIKKYFDSVECILNTMDRLFVEPKGD